MKRFLVSLFLWSFFVGSAAAFATYFPHVAAGSNFKTIIFIRNSNSEAVSYSVKFFNDTGAAETFTIDGSAVPEVTGAILGGGTAKIQLGGQTLKSAYAVISSDKPLTATLLFQSLDGQQITETVGVLPASSFRKFAIFVEDKPNESIGTGLALLNPGGSSATLSLKLYNLSGTLVDAKALVIGAKDRIVKFVNELVSSGGITGSLVIESDQPLMPLTLKFEKGLLTSLPAMRVFQKTNAKLNAGGSEASQTWFVAEENDNLFVTIKNTPSASFTANEYEAIGRRMGSVGLLMEGGSQLHAFYSPDNPESAASTGKGLSFAKTAPGQNSEFIWATDRDKQPTLSTPAGTNIEIEKNSLSVRRNVFGFLEVSGRVKNHNISDATFVQVGIIAYDENNRLAGGETTYIEGTNRKLTSVYTNTCLLPGETGYFETLGLTIDFAKAKRIEYFALAWVRSSSAPSGRLTVTSHTVSRDSLGYATVAGVVKNSGTVPIKSVRVYVIGLDGSGKVLGVSSSTSPTKTSLARDESTSFSKSTLMNYSEVRSVDFRGEWDDDTSSTVATIESEMKSLTVPELRELRDIRIREQLKRERLAHPQSEFVSFAQEHIRVK